MMRRHSLGLLLGAIVIGLVGEVAALAQVRDRYTPAQGHLVAIGGGPIGPEIWHHLSQLAGGWQAPVVFIPTAAEGEPGERASDFLRRAGFTNVVTLHTRDRAEADREAFVAPLLGARLVFFGGGRQWRLVDSYAGTRTEKALAAVLSSGGVLAGTSAGATILGSYLVRGAREGNTIMMAPGYETGFGFLKNIAIDQHLLKRGRENDLWEVIDRKPELLGIGIDEGTAVHFAADRFRVYGASLVAVYDAQYSQSKPRHFFLAPGAAYDLLTRRIID
ncbi:MAG: cyanophycinase [Bryobacter sp.]|nr:cyanophycinase [Bryobacter sp.]